MATKLLPDNFTGNDVVFDEGASEEFMSLVNDFIKPLHGKVFIRNKDGKFNHKKKFKKSSRRQKNAD